MQQLEEESKGKKKTKAVKKSKSSKKKVDKSKKVKKEKCCDGLKQMKDEDTFSTMVCFLLMTMKLWKVLLGILNFDISDHFDISCLNTPRIEIDPSI